MKKANKAALALLTASCLATGLLWFTACDQTDDLAAAQKKVYDAYTASGGTLSFDDWLIAIHTNGKDGVDGKDGTDGKDGKGIVSIDYADGSLIFTFTDGTTQTVDLPEMHAHQYSSEWKYDDEVHFQVCIEEGCGVRANEAQHVWEESEKADATCTEDGVVKYSCTVCGAEKTVTSQKLGHSYGEWTVTNPTATATGTATKTCSRCSDAVSVTLPVLNDPAYTRTDDTASCTEAGTVTYTYNKDGDTVSFTVETPKKDHEGIWEVTKTPTASVSGSATKKCTVCREVLETGLLPLLVSQNVGDNKIYESYQTIRQPNCTEVGIDVYKVSESRYPGLNASFEAEIAALGHSYRASAPAQATGGTAQLECTRCHDSKSYSYDKGVSIAASNTTATAQVLENGKAYFVQSTVATAANYYYSFTVTQGMVEAGSYKLEFVPVTGLRTGVWLYSMTVGGATMVSSRGAGPTFTFGTVTTENGTSVPGTNFACNANLLNITFHFTSEHVGQAVVFNIRLTQATATNDYSYYLMSVGEAEDPIEGNVLGVKENTVVITDTYTYVDTYTFTAPSEGNYTIIVPEGMIASRGTDPNNDDFKTFFDSVESGTASYVFAATQGEKFQFWFSYTQTGTYSVIIAEGGEVDDGKLVIDLDSPVTNITLNRGDVLEITVGKNVEEGDYVLAITGTPVLFRSTIQITVNGVTYLYRAGSGASRDEDFAKTIHLKAGDVITVSYGDPTPNSNLQFTLTKA